jgi:hypothetical protein
MQCRPGQGPVKMLASKALPQLAPAGNSAVVKASKRKARKRRPLEK